jgi:hypothetical protein
MAMSFLYDPHSKRPQIWTYPFFILITLGICFAFYSYGKSKADKMGTVVVNTEEERNF